MKNSEEFCQAVYDLREHKLRISRKRRKILVSLCIPILLTSTALSFSPALRQKSADLVNTQATSGNVYTEFSKEESTSDAVLFFLMIEADGESVKVKNEKKVEAILSLLAAADDEKPHSPTEDLPLDENPIKIKTSEGTVYQLYKETKTVTKNGALIPISAENFDRLLRLVEEEIQ